MKVVYITITLLFNGLFNICTTSFIWIEMHLDCTPSDDFPSELSVRLLAACERSYWFLLISELYTQTVQCIDCFFILLISMDRVQSFPANITITMDGVWILGCVKMRSNLSNFHSTTLHCASIIIWTPTVDHFEHDTPDYLVASVAKWNIRKVMMRSPSKVAHNFKEFPVNPGKFSAVY